MAFTKMLGDEKYNKEVMMCPFVNSTGYKQNLQEMYSWKI
jgi:hypothetical protein